MELYIGGYAQGKAEYVQNTYPEACLMDVLDLSEIEGKMQKQDIIINHFHFL